MELVDLVLQVVEELLHGVSFVQRAGAPAVSLWQGRGGRRATPPAPTGRPASEQGVGPERRQHLERGAAGRHGHGASPSGASAPDVGLGVAHDHRARPFESLAPAGRGASARHRHQEVAVLLVGAEGADLEEPGQPGPLELDGRTRLHVAGQQADAHVGSRRQRLEDLPHPGQHVHVLGRQRSVEARQVGIEDLRQVRRDLLARPSRTAP